MTENYNDFGVWKRLPPALSSEKCAELIEKYKKTKDIKIRDQIVYGTLRFVAKFIFNFGRNVLALENQSFSDLLQECTFVTMNAIEKFDESFGCTFSTYLSGGLKNKFGSLCRKAEAQCRSAEIVSLDALIEDGKANENARTKHDTLAAKNCGEEDVITTLDLRFIKKKILPSLPTRQKAVFACYYFNDMTQAEIAKCLNCARRTVIKDLQAAKEKVCFIYKEGEKKWEMTKPEKSETHFREK